MIRHLLKTVGTHLNEWGRASWRVSDYHNGCGTTNIVGYEEYHEIDNLARSEQMLDERGFRVEKQSCGVETGATMNSVII